MATVLIVEDEWLIAEEIRRALVRLGHSPLSPVDNSEDALEVLATQAVELVLMDINIAGECDGIATAIQVRRRFAVPVVFLTARSDTPTLQRVNLAKPYGYITKPFTDDSLKVQLELALLKADETPPPRPPVFVPPVGPPLPAPTEASTTSMFVRKGNKFVRILYADIQYFEADDKYVLLHTTTEEIMIAEKLAALETTLPPHFMRVHRSYIININHVAVFEDSAVEVPKVEVGGKVPIPVGRSFKAELKNRLNTIG